MQRRDWLLTVVLTAAMGVIALIRPTLVAALLLSALALACGVVVLRDVLAGRNATVRVKVCVTGKEWLRLAVTNHGRDADFSAQVVAVDEAEPVPAVSRARIPERDRRDRAARIVQQTNARNGWTTRATKASIGR